MQIHRLFSGSPSDEMFVPNTLPSAPTARRLRAVALSRLAFAALLTGLLAGTAAEPVASAQTTATVLRPESGAVTKSSDLVAIPGGFKHTTDADLGHFSSEKMTVEVVLAPANEPELNDFLTKLYDTTSPSYHQWLGTGEFNSRFAPSAAQIAAVEDHLQAHGLVVEASASPFRVRASGSSSNVEEAFGTTLHNYRSPGGTTYYSNASEIRMPTSLAAGVRGVTGLSNIARLGPKPKLLASKSTPAPLSSSCEAPYPTEEELFTSFNDNEFGPLGLIGFPQGYGGGPDCTGLTPSQRNSIYGAPDVGPRGQGEGVTLAVLEESGYQHSDIETWAHTFYGPAYTPPLVDLPVDGGPLNPICPAGDTCQATDAAFGGDGEVDEDIEMELSIAPAAKNILVYNTPNDETGQTQVDLWTRMANDNRADVISNSWPIFCESTIPIGYLHALHILFEQMAAQGQSVFTAAGDFGVFSCFPGLRYSASDPWVTAVGGTSLESFNPGADPNPRYPEGVETVWNAYDLCSEQAPNAGNDNQGGGLWCFVTGAGGGGTSAIWGRPFYQFGPGVTSSYTTYGNGTTQCALAPVGTPCREIPDISADADGFTAYAEYCTANANTPGSECGAPLSGWFAVAGTSASSPFWAGVIADRVGYFHRRVGNANPLLYLLFNLDYQGYFHDITGIGQAENNNGLYPVTPGYDMATGIGTPKMGALITGHPEY